LNLPRGIWSGVTITVDGTPGDDRMQVEVLVEAVETGLDAAGAAA
jgi:hypothetical protein